MPQGGAYSSSCTSFEISSHSKLMFWCHSLYRSRIIKLCFLFWSQVNGLLDFHAAFFPGAFWNPQCGLVWARFGSSFTEKHKKKQIQCFRFLITLGMSWSKWSFIRLLIKVSFFSHQQIISFLQKILDYSSMWRG